MSLEMRTECEVCNATLEDDGIAFICSYECTSDMDNICPNCGGELVARPRRLPQGA
ncbi:MAG TPA: DUF1272 domain-containing protein [Rubrobacter sp.]